MKLLPNDTEIAHKHVPASRHKARKIMGKLGRTQTLSRLTFSQRTERARERELESVVLH